MEHLDAIRTRAVERYALQEMPVEEAEEFEEHFFSCEECTRDMQALTALRANVRAVMKDRQGEANGRKPIPFPAGRQSAWRQWIPSAAAACLAVMAVLGWQSFTRHPGAAPQALASFALRAESRGEPNQVVIPAGVNAYSVYFDVVWDEPADSYRCTFEDRATGSTKATVNVPAPAPGQPLFVLLNRETLRSGSYKVTISNSSDKQLAELEFNLQLQ